MDNSFRRLGSESQQPSDIKTIFNNILNWFTQILQLSEEEQKAAGIYLGDQDTK